MISEFTDSRRWWDCDKDGWIEWTYEGRRKAVCRVETDGNSACYKWSTYQKLYVK